MSEQASSDIAPEKNNRQANILFTVGCTVVALMVFIFVGPKQGQLFVLGGALGFVLFQASFGFTAGFSHVS